MNRVCGWFCLVLLLISAGCAPPRREAVPSAPSSNVAVLNLLEKAAAFRAAGRLPEAGAALERAVRIEPRNARLWQELARVRLGQGQYWKAENLAAKSNALAVAGQGLRRENWRIIGQARSKRGDQQGARAAFEKAAQD